MDGGGGGVCPAMGTVAFSPHWAASLDSSVVCGEVVAGSAASASDSGEVASTTAPLPHTGNPIVVASGAEGDGGTPAPPFASTGWGSNIKSASASAAGVGSAGAKRSSRNALPPAAPPFPPLGAFSCLSKSRALYSTKSSVFGMSFSVPFSMPAGYGWT